MEKLTSSKQGNYASQLHYVDLPPNEQLVNNIKVGKIVFFYNKLYIYFLVSIAYACSPEEFDRREKQWW